MKTYVSTLITASVLTACSIETPSNRTDEEVSTENDPINASEDAATNRNNNSAEEVIDEGTPSPFVPMNDEIENPTRPTSEDDHSSVVADEININPTFTVPEGFDLVEFISLCQSDSYTASFKKLQETGIISNLNCMSAAASIAATEFVDLSLKKDLNLAEEILATMGHLKLLDISNQSYDNLSFIGKLTHLETLIANSINLDESFVFPELTNLKTLSLDSVKIADEPITDISSLANLPDGLSHLYLSNNSIEDLSAIAKLKNLLALDLSNNRIKSLSELPASLKLARLELAGNDLVDSDVKFIFDRLKTAFGTNDKLNYLNLSHNKIAVANQLGTFSHVYMLNLANNLITDPSGLFASDSLRRVKYLNLYTPQTTFPAANVLQVNMSGVLLWSDSQAIGQECPLKGNIGLSCFFRP